MSLKQVELLGKKYTAERLTKVAMLGVISKFARNGEVTQADMIDALTNPETIERMAYWLSYIFPEMAKDGIVWHGVASHPKAGIDLELKDLLTLLVKLTEWTTGDSFQEWAEKQESLPTPEPVAVNPEITALNAQLDALTRQIEALKPTQTLSVPSPVAAMDKALAQTLLNS